MGWNLWIALALLGAAIWSVQIRLKRRRAIQAMSGWTQLTGTVRHHDLEATSSTDGDGRLESYHVPKLSYEYEVGGQTYSGSRLSLEGPSFDSRSEAQAYLDAHPIGAEVPVFVNPAQPSEALLSTKVDGAGWWVPLFFLLLAVAVAVGSFGQ